MQASQPTKSRSENTEYCDQRHGGSWLKGTICTDGRRRRRGTSSTWFGKTLTFRYSVIPRYYFGSIELTAHSSYPQNTVRLSDIFVRLENDKST